MPPLPSWTEARDEDHDENDGYRHYYSEEDEEMEVAITLSITQPQPCDNEEGFTTAATTTDFSDDSMSEDSMVIDEGRVTATDDVVDDSVPRRFQEADGGGWEETKHSRP